MKTLKKFAFPETRGGSGTTYDWDKLLDGGIYELTEGADFTAKKATVGMLARKNAKKRGKTVRLANTETGLVIQAFDSGVVTPEEQGAEAAE